MEWVIHLLRQHSELAIFLTIAAGFWIGKIKVGQFTFYYFYLQSVTKWDRNSFVD